MHKHLRNHKASICKLSIISAFHHSFVSDREILLPEQRYSQPTSNLFRATFFYPFYQCYRYNSRGVTHHYYLMSHPQQKEGGIKQDDNSYYSKRHTKFVNLTVYDLITDCSAIFMLSRLLPMFNRIRKICNNIKETCRKFDISRGLKDEMVVVMGWPKIPPHVQPNDPK